MGIDKIAGQFQYLFENPSNNRTAPYDVTATVLKIDGNTAWVHIPGGVDETPVEKTIDAKIGDSVKIRVSGGRAWIVGNSTSPPTDDTRANRAIYISNKAIDNSQTAMENADVAKSAAEAAIGYALDAETAAAEAQQSAQEAKADAEDAHTAANEAKADAAEAHTQADIATGYANNALTQLSVVEDVVGVLEWISEHATYKASTDTEVVAGKMYFTKSGNTYTPVASPSGNPSTAGYYEIDTIDEAVTNYISSHLALTNQGLWVVNDNNSYKILLASDGMKVYDESGNLVSTFGESIEFSSTRAQYIGGEDAYIVFNPTDGSMTIGGSKVNISGNITLGGETKPLSEVLSDMQTSVDSKVSDVVIEYAKSDLPTVRPESGWDTATPTWEEGKYIWQRTTKVINGEPHYTYTCVQGAKGDSGEDAVLVYIHSSNGMAFKNDSVNTTLTVTIYYGSQTIVNKSALLNAFGEGSYLQWKAKLHGESTYTTIPTNDPRLSNDSFIFTLTPADVNVQAVFVVEVIVPD